MSTTGITPAEIFHPDTTELAVVFPATPINTAEISPGAPITDTKPFPGVPIDLTTKMTEVFIPAASATGVNTTQFIPGAPVSDTTNPSDHVPDITTKVAEFFPDTPTTEVKLPELFPVTSTWVGFQPSLPVPTLVQIWTTMASKIEPLPVLPLEPLPPVPQPPKSPPTSGEVVVEIPSCENCSGASPKQSSWNPSPPPPPPPPPAPKVPPQQQDWQSPPASSPPTPQDAVAKFPCKTNEDCASVYVCTAEGTCADRQCGSGKDSDCPRGYHCFPLGPKGRCHLCARAPLACTTQGCPAGQVCANGGCKSVPPSSSSWRTDEVVNNKIVNNEVVNHKTETDIDQRTIRRKASEAASSSCLQHSDCPRWVSR
jgi:hypothetical protein